MEKESKKNVDWRPIWIYLLITVVSVVIIGFVSGIVAGIKGLPIEEVTNNSNVIASIFAEFIILIIFLIIYGKKLFTAIRAINKKQIILIIVSTILLIAINEIITSLLELLNVTMDNQDLIVGYLEVYQIPMIIMTIICAPIIEELVFRYSLGTVCKKDITFIIISGLLFGFAHGVGLASIVYIYMGVSLAIIYLKSDKNIVIPMSVHFFNNLVAVLSLLLLK